MHNQRFYIGIILAIAALLFCISGCHNEPENWTHRTFQGTVTEVWTENGQQFFTICRSIGENRYNEHSFVISADTLSSFSFEVGDEILVETDYNMNEHNGTTVPYPAVLIADPNFSDKR